MLKKNVSAGSQYMELGEMCVCGARKMPVWLGQSEQGGVFVEVDGRVVMGMKLIIVELSRS